MLNKYQQNRSFQTGRQFPGSYKLRSNKEYGCRTFRSLKLESAVFGEPIRRGRSEDALNVGAP